MKQQKNELRKLIRQRKARYNSSTLKELSEPILERLENSSFFQLSQTVLLYFSMDDEVYTHQFIEKWSKTKSILLPAVVNDTLELRTYSASGDLKIGAYGIKEPDGKPFADYNSIDMVVVPGVAFDSYGSRLGRGKGYYDKLLPKLKAPKAGLCFSFQLVDYVPAEEFDVQMDFVISS